MPACMVRVSLCVCKSIQHLSADNGQRACVLSVTVCVCVLLLACDLCTSSFVVEEEEAFAACVIQDRKQS